MERCPARDDSWAALRGQTRARVGLDRAGDTQSLRHVLEFQLAHALARDAVHAPLDAGALEAELAPGPVIRVRSAAADRATYLRRPDLGRRLDPDCQALLPPGAWDVVFVVADGLSATATHANALPLLAACRQRMPDWRIAPVVIASQARVALGDEIGQRLGARLCAMLIGERPGLSVADSLGVYLTYEPRPGRRDSERNCISNIHAHGLGHAQAAETLVWLMTEARRRALTGILLKDRTGAAASSLSGWTD